MTPPKTLPHDIATELRRMAIRMVSESRTKFSLEWAERLRALADRVEGT